MHIHQLFRTALPASTGPYGLALPSSVQRRGQLPQSRRRRITTASFQSQYNFRRDVLH